ncbi:MAG: hypothetical protein GC204_16485 [Chloroflexi bacterium]|nr:hypothetical protein [Chloroflexota bacterium]
MTDVFDWIIRQEIEPGADVRPVLQPIFPLVVPEREARGVLIVPTFSADAELTADAPPMDRDRLTPRDVQARAFPRMTETNQTAMTLQTPSAVVSPVPPPAPIGIEPDAPIVPKPEAQEESPVIVPAKAAIPVRRVVPAAPPETLVRSDADQVIPSDTATKIAPDRAIQPERAGEIFPAAPRIIARPVQTRPRDSAPPIVPSLPIEETPDSLPATSASEPPEIRIIIGRVEVRTTDTPPTSMKKPAKPNMPRLSLEDYLRSRSNGGSS